MAENYVFTLQPTFTQGLILGQLSILCLLYLILKYLFLDSTRHPIETATYHPRVDGSVKPRKRAASNVLPLEPRNDEEESAEWLNSIVRQLSEVYRAKLRDHKSGLDGDEEARIRVENFANRVRPKGFMDHISVHSVDLGVASPRLLKGRRVRKTDSTTLVETEFDVYYADSVSISLSTSYLFNYPRISFARLPISLTISLSLFEASICITPPEPNSVPCLTLSLSPDFTLDLSCTSLMGSRAKLANIPKLHELIQHQLHQVLASRGPWKVPLPNMSSVPEIKEEIKEELKEELAEERVS